MGTKNKLTFYLNSWFMFLYFTIRLTSKTKIFSVFCFCLLKKNKWEEDLDKTLAYEITVNGLSLR